MVVARHGINQQTGVARTFFYSTSIHKAEAVLWNFSILRGERFKSDGLNKEGSRVELLYVGEI